jgi:asparagine synthase (glutamine-hydrolysing)
VLRYSLGSLWRKSKPAIPLARHRAYIKLLTAAATDAAAKIRPHYEHLWVRDARGLPHCKIQHIRMMSQPMTVRPPLSRPDGPEYVHPLVTQLVIELCAATPTYLLTMGGRTRAIARAAFSAEVPAPLLARRSKGNPSTFVSDLIAANTADLRETLLDGQLVKRGILNQARLEQALSGNPTDITPSEILMHACTERWVQLQGGSQTSSLGA